MHDFNGLYKKESALHELDFDGGAFKWIDFHDAEKNAIRFLRYGKSSSKPLAIV